MKRKTNRRGNMLIETALVLPVLFWLTFGLIEYGWWFLQSQQITNAARQGARAGARADATAADVQAAISASLAAVQVDSGYSVALSAAPDALDTGELFSVTVEYPYSEFGFFFPLIPSPPDISKTVTMAREGS